MFTCQPPPAVAAWRLPGLGIAVEAHRFTRAAGELRFTAPPDRRQVDTWERRISASGSQAVGTHHDTRARQEGPPPARSARAALAHRWVSAGRSRAVWRGPVEAEIWPPREKARKLPPPHAPRRGWQPAGGDISLAAVALRVRMRADSPATAKNTGKAAESLLCIPRQGRQRVGASAPPPRTRSRSSLESLLRKQAFTGMSHTAAGPPASGCFRTTAENPLTFFVGVRQELSDPWDE